MVSMWLFLSCLVATSTALNSTYSTIADYVRSASEGKTEILYQTLAKTHQGNGLEVTESFRWKLGTVKGTAASSFRSFGQSFILSDPYLYLISLNPNSSVSLRSVLKIDQSSQVLFIESVEWRNVLFVLLAFKSGILHLLKVTDSMVYDQHKLSCCDEPSKCVPKAAEFFTQDGQLYLVLISNSVGAVPVIFYHWKNTDLDRLDDVIAQIDVEHVTSPTALATFPSKDSTVVVVARDKMPSSKGGLSIYMMKRNIVKLVQIVKSDKVMGLLPFLKKNQPQLLVLTSSPPSVIYAWNGKQLTSKTPVPSLSKAKTASVSYVDDFALLLVPKKNVVQLLSPSGLSFGSSATVVFPAEVDSATLHQNKDDIFLIVILKENDGKLSSMAVQLNITVPKESEKITLPTDEVVTCIDSLRSALSARKSILLDLLSARPKLLLRGQAGKLSGKLVVNTPHKVVLRKGTQSTIVINPQDYNFTASPSQLQDEIISKLATAESVRLSLPGLVKKKDPLTWSSGSQGSLKLSTLKAANAVIDNPIANTLNKRGYAPERLLKYSKDQTLTGKISAENVDIDTAFVGSLSGMNVEDLLWNSGVQQTVAIKEVASVTAGLVNVVSGKINDIPLGQVVRTNLPAGTLIRGLKEAPSIAVSQLGVGFYNNVELTSWWNKIRPVDEAKRKVHVTSDLSIKNLTVNVINDIKLNTLLGSLFRLGKRQEISGTVKFLKKPSIVKLTSQNIAGKPSSNLMTLSSYQVFNGTVSVGALSAPQLITNSVNKLNLATDVARLNSPTVFTGYVAFADVVVKELELPSNTYIMGQLLSPYFLQGQRHIYKQPVRIRGTLKVIGILLNQTKVTVKGKPVSIPDLPSIYWTKNTPQIVPTSLLSRSPLVVKSVTAQTINRVQPDAFLHCDTLDNLAVPWSIPSAMIVGNVNHLQGSRQNPLNPVSLSKSVVLTSGNFPIQGKKIFTGGIQVHRLRTDLLDNVDPSNAVLRSGSTLPGGNTWNQIQIKKDLIIEADLIPTKVNNIDLCSKISRAVKIDEPATIKSILMNTVTADDLSLGVLNGVPLKGRQRRSVTPHLKRLVVKGKVTVPELQYVDSVNNIKLNEFLPFVVNRTTGAWIEGRKSFLAQVTVQQAFGTTKVNGVDLNTFVGALLSRSKAQNVTALFSIDTAKARRLDAWDVNNFEIGKVLTSDALGTAQIFGNLRFSRGLHVGDLISTSLLNGCDVKKIVDSLSVMNGGSWSSLKIDGDLSWLVSRVPLNLAERGLGYLLDSAVKKMGDNVIVGGVTFAAPFGVGDIISDKDIDDVALDFIKNDSLMKKSPSDQVIKMPIRFVEKVQASSLRVSGNVDVVTINDISLLELNNSIVRKSGSSGPIRGRKVFLGGIKASKVICDAFVNDFVASSIVSYDMPRLPPIELNAKMEIVGNLTFTSSNNINIQQLLEERVTLDSQQTISGTITFVDDLVIKDQSLVSNINNVDVATVVTLDNPATQKIFGPKVLTQTLTVEGPLELDHLNGLNFAQSVYEALLKDLPTEGATITGSVTFAAPITLENDLTVDGTVNGVTLDELQRRLQRKAIKYPIRAREKLLKEVRLGKGLLSARRNYEEVMYLDSVENLDVRVSNMSRVIARPKMDRIVLDVYGSDAERNCGLPEGCACPVQMSVELNEEGGKLVSGTWNKLVDRIFRFDVSDTVIEISTNTVSRDSRCRLSPEDSALEGTKVTWLRSTIGPEGTVGVSVGSGYVSDAALLQYEDLIFVVIGLSYDPVQDATNINSKMIRFDSASNSFKLAQEIPTLGVSALNVFTAASIPHLVVGNSYNSVNNTSQVPLYIYRFNTTTYQLDMKRKIPTVGVVAVASLVDGLDTVIIVAQAQTNAPVLVFKYDPMYDSFKVSQQLENFALPTGLGTFRVSDGFVGLATADDIFRLYKYCHIQGLKLVQEYQKVGVRGFARFDFTKRYLFLASSEESSLVELIVQGG